MKKYTIQFEEILKPNTQKISMKIFVAATSIDEAKEICNKYFAECQYSDTLPKVIERYLPMATVFDCDEKVARVIDYQAF